MSTAPGKYFLRGPRRSRRPQELAEARDLAATLNLVWDLPRVAYFDQSECLLNP
jgi:hypothetical protein